MRHTHFAPALLALLGACSGEPPVSSADVPRQISTDGDPVPLDNPDTPDTPVCKTITVSGHVYYNDLRTNGRFSLRYRPPFGFGGLMLIGSANPYEEGGLNKNYLGLLDATVELSERDGISVFQGCQPHDFVGETTINSAGYWTWSGQVCDSCRDDMEGAEDNGISISAKIKLENCSAPNTRCFSVLAPDASAPTGNSHYDDDWTGTLYSRWHRGASSSAPIVIHGNTVVDIGTDYFQEDPTPGPGNFYDLDAQAASVFASAVDVTRKLHVDNNVRFQPDGGEVEIYFPDVVKWSHSHQDASNRICINAPDIRNWEGRDYDLPDRWFDGSVVAHEYGHLVHYWQWDGNGKWVSYEFDSDNDGQIDQLDEDGNDMENDGDNLDEEASSSETREYVIAALKEGWAELVEHVTFDGTGSPSACDAVETDPAQECTGPATCTNNRHFYGDVKHALCDLYDGSRNTEGGDTVALSIRTLADTLAEIWDNQPANAADVASATINNRTTASFGMCDIARRIINRGSATRTAMIDTLAQSLLDCGL